jgi:hypothetical protein
MTRNRLRQHLPIVALVIAALGMAASVQVLAGGPQLQSKPVSAPDAKQYIGGDNFAFSISIGSGDEWWLTHADDADVEEFPLGTPPPEGVDGICHNHNGAKISGEFSLLLDHGWRQASRVLPGRLNGHARARCRRVSAPDPSPGARRPAAVKGVVEQRADTLAGERGRIGVAGFAPRARWRGPGPPRAGRSRPGAVWRRARRRGRRGLLPHPRRRARAIRAIAVKNAGCC